MNKSGKIFPIILLNARPAAGKSEIIKFLNALEDSDRAENYHIGKIHVIDDFPYLWRWFEEDNLLAQMGKSRLYTDAEGYFKDVHLWDLLIKMINLEYEKFMRDVKLPSKYTIFIEFSRGTEHGGYKRAFPLLNSQILDQASILYVNVSWEESLRKNRSRFNPLKPDSILEHSLPDEKLKRLYYKCDFQEMAANHPDLISINNHNIPYVILDNEDDATTKMDEQLGIRLKTNLEKLWRIYSKMI